MDMDKTRETRIKIERAIGEALIDWTEKENPKLSRDEVMEDSIKNLDSWEIKGSNLSEDEDGVLKYTLIVERPGLVIGSMGKQIKFLIERSKEILGFDYELHLNEQKRSHLYDVMDGWFSMRMLQEGIL